MCIYGIYFKVTYKFDFSRKICTSRAKRDYDGIILNRFRYHHQQLPEKQSNRT